MFFRNRTAEIVIIPPKAQIGQVQLANKLPDLLDPRLPNQYVIEKEEVELDLKKKEAQEVLNLPITFLSLCPKQKEVFKKLYLTGSETWLDQDQQDAKMLMACNIHIFAKNYIDLGKTSLVKTLNKSESMHQGYKRLISYNITHFI